LLGGSKGVRAFTLIEVLAAIFMFGLAAASFAALLQSSARTQASASTYQQAASLAQHKIDQLRGVGYGRLVYGELLSAGVIDAAAKASPYSFTQIDGLTEIHPNATGTIQVSEYGKGMRLATVTVSWPTDGKRRVDGTVTLVALVGKP
jgi:prepilin-type N-terminal cleavage/methylation domain-containing protein